MLMSRKYLLLAALLGLIAMSQACGGGKKSKQSDAPADDSASDKEDCDCDDKDGGDGSDENANVENNPCYNDELGKNMDDIMNGASSSDDAGSNIRDAGVKFDDSQDWNGLCSDKDFAFRNYYSGDNLCKRNTNGMYCLVYAD